MLVRFMSSGFRPTCIEDVYNPKFDLVSGMQHWSCQPSPDVQTSSGRRGVSA